MMWLDVQQTLFEDRNRDTWQMPVADADGTNLGNVVAQIVEPQACMVRYFILYDPVSNRHVLLPSDTVESIDDQIHSVITADSVAKLPKYEQTLERCDELHIYHILAHSPYWES